MTKKKLEEWESEFEEGEFEELKKKLSEEDTEKTYSKEELRAMLQSTEQGWIKQKWEWAKENWLPLLIGAIIVSFVIYILKSLWKAIFGGN